MEQWSKSQDSWVLYQALPQIFCVNHMTMLLLPDCMTNMVKEELVRLSGAGMGLGLRDMGSVPSYAADLPCHLG